MNDMTERRLLRSTYLGTRKKIRYPLPSFLLVHCCANAPYVDHVSGTLFRRTSLSSAPNTVNRKQQTVNPTPDTAIP